MKSSPATSKRTAKAGWGTNGSIRPVLIGNDPFSYLRRFESLLERFNLETHYFEPVEGVSGNHVVIRGREFLNYSGYNYLGFSGEERVSAAAKAAIDSYGTSVSASRLVAGERPLHHELERELASLIGAEACLVYVS